MGGLIYESQDVNFNLEEVETEHQKGRFHSDSFIPLQTELILRLQSVSSLLLPGLLKGFNENLEVVFPDDDIEKLVRCNSCGEQPSYFPSKDGFQPLNRADLCTEGIHRWDKNLLAKESSSQEFESIGKKPEKENVVAISTKKNWNFSCIIANHDYKPGQEFESLLSTRKDFEELVPALLNAGYDLSLMN